MERRLAAILAADVVGYSRSMGEDEAGTLSELTRLRKDLIEPLISEHRGRVVKLMGDGILAEFASVIDAVSCAVRWQNDLGSNSALQYRIGINLGDIIIEDDDIYGNGVNVASRLEGLADPGGICLSGPVYGDVKNKLDLVVEDLGEQSVKNIAEPVRVYRIAGHNSQQANQPALPDMPSIAVLAFTNMSGEAEQEYLSDGISEDIITALSKLPKLFVVARNSTFTYKGKAVDLKQVGREQGVRYVLEGSVRHAGDRLRITAQLVDATTGHHIWAESYNRVVQDVFTLQDEITREVVSALQIELTDGEQARMWSTGTDNLEAWKIVIQIPQYINSHRREDVPKVRRLAKQALKLDENYAAAWNCLGWSHYLEVFNGWTDTPDTALGKAMTAAQRALSADDKYADTYNLLTFIHMTKRDYDEALRLSELGLELAPSNSLVAAVSANVAMYCNRPQEMAALIKKAMRLCPIYPAWYAGDLAWANLLMDRREDAIATAQEAIKIDPDYVYTYIVLAITYAELGREREAGAAVDNILRIEPDYSLGTFATSQPFRDTEVMDRHIDGLRMAGLPE